METSTLKEESSIFVMDGADWIRINLEEIMYIQSDTNSIFIYEKNRKISTRMTLKARRDILPNERFKRVHKSFIMALIAIQKLERHHISIDTIFIPLAANYREGLEEKLMGK